MPVPGEFVMIAVASPAHAQAVIRTWAREHNDERPKKILGGLTPAEYAKQFAAKAITRAGPRWGDRGKDLVSESSDLRFSTEKEQKMTRRKRRNHSSAVKAKVALAALKAERTPAELAEQFYRWVVPAQIMGPWER